MSRSRCPKWMRELGAGGGGRVLTFVAAGSALHKRHHFWTEKP